MMWSDVKALIYAKLDENYGNQLYIPMTTKEKIQFYGPYMLTAVIALLLVRTGIVIAGRVMFPWDWLSWNECPILTDMLKLNAGVSVYSDPLDANSYLYAPGLAYWNYIWLRPFGLDLDIRALRALSCLTGMAGAFLAAAFMAILRERELNQKAGAPFWICSFGISLLVIFDRFTSDTSHPDNLVLLHALALLLLTLLAVDRRSLSIAIAAAAFAGIGIIIKQSSIFAPLGVIAACFVAGPWRGRDLAAIIAVAISSAILMAVLAYGSRYARFYAYEIPSIQGIHWERLSEKIVPALIFDRQRLFLIVCALASSYLLLRSSLEFPRRAALIWIILGLSLIPIHAAAILNEKSGSNNLGLLDMWCLLIMWPWFWAEAFGRETCAPKNTPGVERERITGRLEILRSPVFSVLILVFVMRASPNRTAPAENEFAFCRAVERGIRNDLGRGKSVWAPNATAVLIRSGHLEPPKDQANSIVEMWHAGILERAGTFGRIRERAYDRIYIGGRLIFLSDMNKVLRENYVELERIPWIRPHGGTPFDLGFFQDVLVFEAKPTETVAQTDDPGAKDSPSRETLGSQEQ